MKKNLASNLLLFSGILTLVSGMINEDKSLGLPLGCAFITLGIVIRDNKRLKIIVKKFHIQKMEKTLTTSL